jgi:hypothetical protein
MELKRIITIALLLIVATHTYAQTYSITGTVTDATDQSSLIGVSMTVTPVGDSSKKQGNITTSDGSFKIENVAAGKYTLRGSYIGFKSYSKEITVTNADISIGTIKLSQSSSTLKNVNLKGKQIRGEQIGDTTQFNADAYKTHKDASAEDLLNKMPGISSQDGTLKAHGENVRQVLVDGKPFFGDDPNAAVKNLPSEVIDKIQVFDKLSDQAQFTGFDDGSSQKTINIITRSNKSNGQFGKFYGGYGTDNRYILGGNINFFKGARRISILGLSNNVNQQNFGSDDLLGVMSGAGGGGGGRGGMGGRGGGGGNFFGGGDGGNFMVGAQNGISTTHSFGVNYTDNWSKKLKVSGSYFFNSSDNDNNTTLSRQYLTGRNNNLNYNETSTAHTTNMNHRFNMRLEYEIDSNNSIVLSPRVSIQNNDATKTLNGNNALSDGTFAGSTVNNSTSHNTGINFSNNLLFRHKFGKRGRTISLNVNTLINNKEGDGKLYSSNLLPKDTNVLDQQYTTITKGYTIAPGLNYTEPIGKKGQLQINYSPSYTRTNADKETNDINPVTKQYSVFDSLLSNRYDNINTKQRGGVGYRYNYKKSSFSVGADAEYSQLDGEQYYPKAFTLSKNFTNILPNAMYQYREEKGKNLRLMYRTNTDIPSISQLQSVVDNSNPLQLRSGNPDLRQSYTHTLSARYGVTAAKQANSLFILAFANFTNNYIGNATYRPTSDTVINSVLVRRGTQLTMPMNLDGNVSLRTFGTYGFPVNLLKSNLNVNAGVNYNRLPSIINNKTNINNNYIMSGGLTLGSNISEKVDFTVAYSGSYNIANNTLTTTANNKYYSQITSLKFNWLFYKGFVFNTSVNHNLYSGLSGGFNQNFVLWNASLGYKFLKDKSLEVKLSVFDLLNQNRSINRTVTDTYIEDSQSNVLKQYFMLNVTYTLRKFKGMMSMPSSPWGNGSMPPNMGRWRDEH